MNRGQVKEVRLFEPTFMFKNIGGCFIATLVLLMIGAAIMVGISASDAVIGISVMVISGLCVMWGGFRAAGHTGRQGALSGLFVGVIYVAIALLAGAIVSGGEFRDGMFLTALVDLACGVIGGMAGVNRKTKRRKRQR